VAGLKKTEEIISLANGKPIAVTGIGRSGTSFLNRQLFRQAVIDNPDVPQSFMEELLRVQPGVYEHHWEPIPRVKDYNKERAFQGYFFNTLSNTHGEIIPVNGRGEGATTKALESLTPRIEKLKEYGLENIHMKIFPMDMCILAQIDEEFAHQILNHYHWIFLYREDWKDAYSSMLFGTLRDKFHFYDDEELSDTDTWYYGGKKESRSFVNPYMAGFVIDQSYSMIESLFTKDVSLSIIEMKEISEIPDNTQEFLDTKVSYRHLIPDAFWTQTPKRFGYKKELAKKSLLNIEKAQVRAEKRLKQIVEGSHGLMSLDGDKLSMDINNVRPGKPEFVPDAFKDKVLGTKGEEIV
tara:strand:+ start:2642 stop:3697 length:1056 start_codon:yes stop_codon:yes gene_type:complete